MIITTKTKSSNQGKDFSELELGKVGNGILFTLPVSKVCGWWTHEFVFEKTKEVIRTLLPVVILVLLLCFSIVNVEADIMIRFIVGSVMLLIGLSIFLWGVDMAMNPIGEHMSREIATSRSFFKIAILSFFLGFLITVAEPDLLILGSQVEAASGGTMNAIIIVYLVSIGVGVMVSLGVFRLLRDKPLNIFMAITYSIIFVLQFCIRGISCYFF